jgi:Ca-activated chloride channel family protein
VIARPTVQVKAQLDRGSVMLHGPGVVRVEVNLDAQQNEEIQVRSASDIVVVVDTSGSMAGEKLHFAKQALFELFDRLEPGDRFGLVQYNTDAEVLIPLQPATAEAKSVFRNIASRLVANGSTNMSAGLDRGAELFGYVPQHAAAGRLVLLSDGLANAGDASEYGLSRRVRRLSQMGYAVSTMGVGEDFDEHMMTALATSGTGAFYYLSKLSYLGEFLEAELNSTRETYARATELLFAPAAGVQLLDTMGLEVAQQATGTVIRLGNLYAGRTRSVWLTLRAPTDQLGTFGLGELTVSYERAGYKERVVVGPLPGVLCLRDTREYERRVNKDVWERGLLGNVFSKAEEDFGDAIRTGDRRVIAEALSGAEQERHLAERLGSKAVIGRLEDLNGKAAAAEQAQAAPAPVRNQEAKKAKARGYQQRNSDSYKSLDSAMKAY